MTDPYITRREIEAQRKSRFSNFERWRNVIIATVFSVGGSIDAPNKPDYVWIHEWGSDHSYGQAMRGGVTVADGMPVMVSRDPKEPYNWKIIGIYTGGLDPGVNNTIYRYEIGQHAENHQIPAEDNVGPDPVKIWAPAYMPLKAEGNGTDMNVIVWGDITYWYGDEPQVASGNSVDLTPYLPAAGNTKYVLLYLNMATGIVNVADGVEVLIASTPAYPSLPSDSLPSAIVQLTFGQTDVTTVDDIIDARTGSSLIASSNVNYNDIMVNAAGDVMTDNGNVLWD